MLFLPFNHNAFGANSDFLKYLLNICIYLRILLLQCGGGPTSMTEPGSASRFSGFTHPTHIQLVLTLSHKYRRYSLSALIQLPLPAPRSRYVPRKYPGHVSFAVRLKATNLHLSPVSRRDPAYTFSPLMQLHSSEQATILCHILARSKARTIESKRILHRTCCAHGMANFMS